LVRAAVRLSLRHGPIAAADGRLNQFTGSGPVLKLGVRREIQLDRGLIAPVFVEFRSLNGRIEDALEISRLRMLGEQPHMRGVKFHTLARSIRCMRIHGGRVAFAGFSGGVTMFVPGAAGSLARVPSVAASHNCSNRRQERDPKEAPAFHRDVKARPTAVRNFCRADERRRKPDHSSLTRM
jgi:hypothetical protein